MNDFAGWFFLILGVAGMCALALAGVIPWVTWVAMSAVAIYGTWSIHNLQKNLRKVNTPEVEDDSSSSS